jgi:hypothetical protein
VHPKAVEGGESGEAVGRGEVLDHGEPALLLRVEGSHPRLLSREAWSPSTAEAHPEQRVGMGFRRKTAEVEGTSEQ